MCDRVDTFDYQNNFAIHTLCDGNLLELNTFRRGDKKLFDLLRSDIDSIDASQFPSRACKKSLAYTNAKRKAVNSYWMDQLKKDNEHLIVTKNKHNKQSQDVYVYKDLPVIACRTNKKLEFVNSETGKVVDFNTKQIVIAIDGKEEQLKLDIEAFRMNFHCAYCITIHRSQGCSIDEAYTIYEWSKLDRKLRYVALSRSRSLSYMNVV